ncbi:MAG: S8 family serine peptidase [Candidatus Nitrosotenuis sp.]
MKETTLKCTMKRLKYFFILNLLVVSTSVASSFAQTHNIASQIITSFNGQTTKFAGLSPSASLIQFFNSKGIIDTIVYDPYEVVDVIVSFSEIPAVVAKTRHLGHELFLRRVQQQQALFKSDLQRIFNELKSRASDAFVLSPEIYRQYTHIFNGVALRATKETIRKVSKLSYVRQISDDVEVEAHLKESVPLIRVDQVWSEFKVHGENILVGVIDTGINYNHPALGGGLGPTFKVIGGYDFVNNDSDPMDDNGHGTHVAGIISADGDSVTGVAPKVKLMAFKVLGANGRGRTSDVIAAIERAVDPDQNSNTDDAVDVLNLSLGSPGNPDDPKSQAIDAATDAGVVCVISAGNNGGYYTIDSPGTARKAITVGASDKNDQMAGFSSKGPNASTFEVKPEVTAPGVAITSTWLGNGYNTLSGTSMAAPHVAGVAALLKQLHPNWDPHMIKAAIVNSAIDLGTNVFTQGAGRIDAYNSATNLTLVAPSVINFGFDQVDQPIWSRTLSADVFNFGSQQQICVFALPQPPPNGMSISFSPGSFALPASSQQSVEIKVDVNNVVLPFPKERHLAYWGYATLTCGDKVIRMPWALIKAAGLKLSFQEAPHVVSVGNWRDYFRLFRIPPKDSTFTILLPPDTYDVMAIYFQDSTSHWSHIVNKAQIPVTGLAVVDIGKHNAVNKLNFSFQSETGHPLYTFLTAEQILHKNIGTGIFVFFGINVVGEHFISDLGPDYVYRWFAITNPNRNKFYFFQGHETGISSDINYVSTAADLTHIPVRYAVADSIKNIYLMVYLWMLQPDPSNPFPKAYRGLGSGLFNGYWLPLPRPFVQDFYFSNFAQSEISNLISGFSLLAFAYDKPPFEPTLAPAPDAILGTPLYSAGQDGHLKAHARGYPGPESLIFDQEVHQITFGLGPSFWFGRFENGHSGIRIYKTRGDFDMNLFSNQMFDSNPRVIAEYRVYENGKIVKSGELPSAWANQWIQIFPIIPILGKTLEIEYPYTLGNISGRNLLKATFTSDHSVVDLNPPYFSSFSLASDGQVTHDLIPHAQNKAKFTLHDDSGLNNVKVFTQSYGAADTAWTELQIENVADTFFVELSNLSKRKGIYNLKIVAADNSGNILATEMSPAFLVGHPPVILNAKIVPDYVEPEDKIALQVSVLQSESTKLIRAEMESPDESVLGNFVLFDDGQHDDAQPHDGIFGNTWTTLRDPRDYFVDLTAVSVSNDSVFKNNITSLTTTKDVHLVVDSLVVLFESGLKDGFANPGETISFKVRVKNHGRGTARNVKLKMVTVDAGRFVLYYLQPDIEYGTINPRSSKLSQQGFVFSIMKDSPDSVWQTIVFEIKDGDGNTWISSHSFVIRVPRIPTSVAERLGGELPNKFELHQNYPNPFNPATTIRYSLPKNTKVTLAVYNILGQEIATLVDEDQKAGRYQVTWSGRNYASHFVNSGIYIYRLEAGEFVETKKMLLLR